MDVLLFVVLIPTLALFFWVLKDVIWWLLPSDKKNAQLKPDEIDFTIPTKHAWQRFIARMLDIYICAAAFGFILAYDAYGVFETIEDNNATLAVIAINICLFYEISCLASFKTTIGKKIMGVDIIFPNIKTTLPAIKRGLLVWYRGMAGGFLFVYLFTMYAGFQNYKKYGKNSWDMIAGTELQCQEIHISRWLLGILIFLSNYVILFLDAVQRLQ